MYVLVDVREPHVYRYVGRTVAKLSHRLQRHKRTLATMPHLRVMRWMAKVGPSYVRIVSLGEYPAEELPFWECFWMAALREAGHDLTNIAHGGSAAGFPKGYYRHSPEARAKAIAGAKKKRKPHSKEWNQAISEGLRRHHVAKDEET